MPGVAVAAAGSPAEAGSRDYLLPPLTSCALGGHARHGFGAGFLHQVEETGEWQR